MLGFFGYDLPRRFSREISSDTCDWIQVHIYLSFDLLFLFSIPFHHLLRSILQNLAFFILLIFFLQVSVHLRRSLSHTPSSSAPLQQSAINSMVNMFDARSPQSPSKYQKFLCWFQLKTLQAVFRQLFKSFMKQKVLTFPWCPSQGNSSDVRDWIQEHRSHELIYCFYFTIF